MRPKSSARRGVTLAEVARAAGVSIATASRVLNGENKENWAGTAARAENIRKIAKKLGYKPDWGARALRGGRTNSIGIVYSETVPMMDITSYGPMLRAFGEVLAPAGYHMMFVHVSPTPGSGAASLLHAVDAAVYYHHLSQGQLEVANVVRGPSILVNCEPRLPYPRVCPDDVGGATALTKHLLELGHRKIAFWDIADPSADFDHYSRLLRLQTMQKVMGEAGLGDHFIHWRANWGTAASELVQRFLSVPLQERPTAVVVFYSLYALSLLNEFVRAGVKVPEQLSLATFDDHDLLETAIVPLTTVAVPMSEMGRAAAGLILGLLQSSTGPRAKTTTLPERLIVRKSTGPVPKAR